MIVKHCSFWNFGSPEIIKDWSYEKITSIKAYYLSG
jgi:hypothetical protein